MLFNAYLFRDNSEIKIEEKVSILMECQSKDIDNIVNFYNYSIRAPKEWFAGYVDGLIEKKEIFSLEIDDKIIGTCEVRKSKSVPRFTDIGMVGSPDFRREGYGNNLLNKPKELTIQMNSTPICSCEKDYIGSIKSIHNCGFVSMYQLLSIDFK